YTTLKRTAGCRVHRCRARRSLATQGASPTTRLFTLMAPREILQEISPGLFRPMSAGWEDRSPRPLEDPMDKVTESSRERSLSYCCWRIGERRSHLFFRWHRQSVQLQRHWLRRKTFRAVRSYLCIQCEQRKVGNH